MSKLQEMRKTRGMSQNDLASLTGISKRVIQAYEQMKDRSLDGAGLDKLVPLALALGCKISDLLEDGELIEQCQKLGI